MSIPLVSATGLVMVSLSVLVAAFALAGIVRLVLAAARPPGAREEDDVRDSE